MRGPPNCLTSRQQRRVEDCIQSQAQWLNQSRLCNETPIKTLVTAAQWHSLVDECINALGGGSVPTPQGEGTKALSRRLSQISASVSLHLASPDLFPL